MRYSDLDVERDYREELTREEYEYFIEYLRSRPELLSPNEKLILILLDRIEDLTDSIGNLSSEVSLLSDSLIEFTSNIEQIENKRRNLLSKTIDGIIIATMVFLVSGIGASILFKNIIWFVGFLGPLGGIIIYWYWRLNYSKKSEHQILVEKLNNWLKLNIKEEGFFDKID